MATSDNLTGKHRGQVDTDGERSAVCVEPGWWKVDKYDVTRNPRPFTESVRWLVTGDGAHMWFRTLKDARSWIAQGR